jgi:WD40 repeat protein
MLLQLQEEMEWLDSGTRGLVRKHLRSRAVWSCNADFVTSTELTTVTANKLVSAFVCDAEKNFIAAGIENPEDGPHESPVYVWYMVQHRSLSLCWPYHRDQRNPSAPTRSFIESHTDTVTSLQLHPNHPTLLLSSSTDGLVNIFDVSQAEEEDALYQVINHKSAIAHAGFLYPGTDIYALGTDETMTFYALQSQKEEEEEPAPKAFGDVREALGCEYLVDMHWIGAQPFVAAGKHRYVFCG